MVLLQKTIQMCIRDRGYGIKQVGVALKGLLFNPYILLFTGLTAIAELWYNSGQKADEMNERISELTTRAQDGFKNLTKEAQKFADVDPVSYTHLDVYKRQ